MEKQSGFTLIELLVVVAIIAILAAIAVPNFLSAQTRAKVSRTKTDLRTISTAMESYAVDSNKYPPNYDHGDYLPEKPTTEYRTYASLTTPVAYMSSVPLDLFRPAPNEPTRGRYFDFYGADTVLTYPDYPIPMRDFWMATGIQWFISSVGPDLHHNKLGENLQEAALFLYDPTNGTVSAGDFGRSNLRSHPAS